VVVYVPLFSVGTLPHPPERLVGRLVVVVVVFVVVSDDVATAVVKVVLGMQFPARHWEYHAF
jgi:hypothetical protein